MKEQIITEGDENKSGITRRVKDINGNSYVGSAVNLRKRLGDYLKGIK